MSYRVFWSPHAEQRLEEILQDTARQAQHAAAARYIDQYLSADPIGFGESRYDTVRVGFVRPLGVQYEVLEDVRTVIVYDVWRIDVRKRG
jgi:plasmid stabilization system protein ParE